MEDSIFEKTEHRTSVSSSDSVFFSVDSLHAPPQFTLLLSFSIAGIHSPPKEDDTMVSVSCCTHLVNLMTHFLLHRCLVVAMFAAALWGP